MLTCYIKLTTQRNIERYEELKGKFLTKYEQIKETLELRLNNNRVQNTIMNSGTYMAHSHTGTAASVPGELIRKHVTRH